MFRPMECRLKGNSWVSRDARNTDTRTVSNQLQTPPPRGFSELNRCLPAIEATVRPLYHSMLTFISSIICSAAVHLTISTPESNLRIMISTSPTILHRVFSAVPYVVLLCSRLCVVSPTPSVKYQVQ